MEQSGLVALTTKTEIEIPDELDTDEERALYVRILESNPSAHLFSRAVEGLAIQLVRHTITANKIARAIRRCNDPKILISLSKAQRDESMAMAALSTKLRLSPSGIAGYRGGFLPTPKDRPPRPWEFDA
jgi:hypothetical protein